MVGIGASAGGIEALRQLLPEIRPDCGLAFVVVQHLDAERPSVLSEILARTTSLPVVQIADRTPVQPNRVHVIPPAAGLSIADGVLRLSRPDGGRPHSPIDQFFASLAAECGDNAGCVILSGTGSDGTIGLRAVKEAGGLTLAQEGAAYDGMMRSAVDSGLVDFVLPAREIPRKLDEYFSHRARFDSRPDGDPARPEATDHLVQISALLRAYTGHDFSGYKDKTIARRVQRRMHVLQLDGVPEFIQRLRKDPREVRLLFQDLLIGVTGFFRDREAFEALEKLVIPRLIDSRSATDTLRVWVPACSTGEEAYSIAILLREAMPKGPGGPRLQVFATDIDEHALEIARLGRYPASIADAMPARLLERYLLREDGTFRIVSELRELCLFSAHNLLRDPPFSRLDMVSCRNLLIYLGPDLQNKVIPLFHYALNPDGYLFLGTSENVTRQGRLFTPVDKTHRIFQRRPLSERQLPDFPLTSPRDMRPRPLRVRAAAEPGLETIAERVLLDRYSPAWVVINAQGDVLRSSGRTGKYLELPSGAPDMNIYGLARSGLRLELRGAVHQAVATGRVVARAGVAIGTNGGRQEIDLYVQPLRYEPDPDPLFLVLFQDIGGLRPEAGPEPPEDTAAAGARQLEAEVRALRERLQSTTEELESSNEELKSSNEELSSMNEELQSANEELETSKEELQSINEELQTVNSELNARIEELARANNDMANLLNSTQMATVFLDRDLQVKSFTPTARDVFRLVESDAGRPISHVRARIHLDGLQEDAERVLRTLATIEKPVSSTEGGTRYMMRILPYRTADGVISGVVLTFTDVTRITAAEARINELTRALRARIGSLETLLDLVPAGVLVGEDHGTREVLVNRYGARLLGLGDDPAELQPLAAPLRMFVDGREVPEAEQPLRRAAATGREVPPVEATLRRADGGEVAVLVSATPLFDEHRKPRGAIAAIVDMSATQEAEAQRRELLHELQHRVKNILATVSAVATRMSRSGSSEGAFRQTFLARLEAMGRLHDVLSRGAWSGAGLRQLLEAALGSLAEPGHVRMGGPDVSLPPGAANSLGMVLYELASNAVKYGALSASGGVVHVAWERVPSRDGEGLRLTWIERGGPSPQPSGHRGFGVNFVERSVGYELDGEAKLDFDPAGLRCTIAFPLTQDRGGHDGTEQSA